jgi:aminoglycoside 6'-N-acetyltransferase
VSVYRFREFTRADLPMITRWLHTPEVVRWWGDPQEQIVLLTEDLDEPQMRQWIVEHDRHPFAYIQAYGPHAWPQPHLNHLPERAEVLDAFIGEPAMLGRGHGSAMLRAFAQRLRAAGAPVVAIDPDPDNHRARRAFARAGFLGEEVVQTGQGPAVLMLF